MLSNSLIYYTKTHKIYKILIILGFVLIKINNNILFTRSFYFLYDLVNVHKKFNNETFYNRKLIFLNLLIVFPINS